MEKCAFVLGASGHVGRQLVKELSEKKPFGSVSLITRRQLEGDDYKDFDQKIVDFDKLGDYTEAFQGYDVGFCCLGTTRAKAGAEGFFKVDHDYVVNSAKLAKENGCKHFLVVSSTGACASSHFLYQSTKGKMEEALKNLGFESLSIFRPAFLLGDREEFRLTEKIVKAAMVPFNFLFPKTGSVHTSIVAKAMIKNASASAQSQPVQVFSNADIHEMGQ